MIGTTIHSHESINILFAYIFIYYTLVNSWLFINPELMHIQTCFTE